MVGYDRRSESARGGDEILTDKVSRLRSGSISSCDAARQELSYLASEKCRDQILVYNPNCAPFFGGDFNPSTDTVSHDPSRKSFLAKLIGFVAVAGIAPRML